MSMYICIVDVVRVNKLERLQVAVFSVAVGTMSIRHYLKPISGLPRLQYRYGAPVSHIGWLPAIYTPALPNFCCPYIFVYVVPSNTTSHLLLTVASHLDLSMARGGPPQLMPTTCDLSTYFVQVEFFMKIYYTKEANYGTLPTYSRQGHSFPRTAGRVTPSHP